MEENLILSYSFAFAIKIIKFCDQLDATKKYVISKQLLRCGTSIGANIREAQNPHSRADFISKMIISIKEAEETEYWLLLCKHSDNYPNPDGLLEDVLSIKKLLGKIITSSKKNIMI